jgi:4-nitrophenyl phosphatase
LTTEYEVLSDAIPRPRAVLLDLDGTLYRGDRPVEGADRMVAAFEAGGTACWFVTNNSARTPEEVAGQLSRMGIPARPDRVITSATAAAAHIRKAKPDARLYVIGERGLREALRQAGLREAEDGEGAADYVVQGIDRELTYAKLRAAVRHLLDGAGYVLTNPDRLLPTESGLLPGAGSIAAALEAASGVRPLVIGKPSAIMMDEALRRAGVGPGEAWVVGDNPLTDLAAARAAGCTAVLTLTGLCTAADWRERCAGAGVRPDAVCGGPEAVAQLYRKGC